jgi:hypothetical protein
MIMYKSIVVISAVVLSYGCAETPEWTPGQDVKKMVELQVANKDVIDNPPEGVVAGYNGARGETVMKAYRSGEGGKNVKKPITASASGQTE